MQFSVRFYYDADGNKPVLTFLEDLQKRLGAAADMSETTKPYNEIDDYIAAFSDEERQEYVAAETALDLASILYQIRQEQGLTQRQAAERAALEARYGQVWNTSELANDFEVMGFAAPFVVVRRKADNKVGSLMFQHHPRYYFSFQ